MPPIALPGTLAPAAAAGFPAAVDLILPELQGAVATVDPAALERAIALLLGADRILAAGAGRSRLALAMGAMRLMHLGLAVHLTGEVMAAHCSSRRCC
jgi:6-phospho-3-hexuloisomerase